MQAGHQGLLDLRDCKTSSVAWPEAVRYDLRCEGVVLQIALVCQSVQCRARATVLDVASKVVIVGLAITERLLVGLATGKKAFDQVNES